MSHPLAELPLLCPRCAMRYASGDVFCPKDGAPLVAGSPEETPDPFLGRVLLDHIEIREAIGAGAMGKVYRAFQSGVDRDVAVKILHRELSSNREIAARFDREAKVVSKISHPNVVSIFLAGHLADDSLYIVMEYLEGPTLGALLRDKAAAPGASGALPLEKALRIVLQVCDAVGAGHDLGVIHRDLKPDNVMLVRRGTDDEVVKVLDFGIARLTEGESADKTASGLIFGTARYISPEGARGELATPASDVYSIATLLYQLLCGRTPFDGEQAIGILVRQIHEDPPPLNEGIPEPLSQVILRNLSKDPAQRDPNGRAFGRSLLVAARDAQLPLARLVARSGLLDSLGLATVFSPLHVAETALGYPRPREECEGQDDGRARSVPTVLGSGTIRQEEPRGTRPLGSLRDGPSAGTVQFNGGSAAVGPNGNGQTATGGAPHLHPVLAKDETPGSGVHPRLDVAETVVEDRPRLSVSEDPAWKFARSAGVNVPGTAEWNSVTPDPADAPPAYAPGERPKFVTDMAHPAIDLGRPTPVAESVQDDDDVGKIPGVPGPSLFGRAVLVGLLLLGLGGGGLYVYRARTAAHSEASADELVVRGRDALARGAFDAQSAGSGENVGDLAARGASLFPGDSRFSQLRASAATALAEAGRSKLAAGDFDGALADAKRARSLGGEAEANALTEAVNTAKNARSAAVSPVPGEGKGAPPSSLFAGPQAAFQVDPVVPVAGSPVTFTVRLVAGGKPVTTALSPTFVVKVGRASITLPAENTAPGTFVASYMFADPGAAELTFAATISNARVAARKLFKVDARPLNGRAPSPSMTQAGSRTSPVMPTPTATSSGGRPDAPVSSGALPTSPTPAPTGNGKWL